MYPYIKKKVLQHKLLGFKMEIVSQYAFPQKWTASR